MAKVIEQVQPQSCPWPSLSGLRAGFWDWWKAGVVKAEKGWAEDIMPYGTCISVYVYQDRMGCASVTAHACMQDLQSGQAEQPPGRAERSIGEWDMIDGQAFGAASTSSEVYIWHTIGLLWALVDLFVPCVRCHRMADHPRDATVENTCSGTTRRGVKTWGVLMPWFYYCSASCQLVSDGFGILYTPLQKRGLGRTSSCLIRDCVISWIWKRTAVAGCNIVYNRVKYIRYDDYIQSNGGV